MGCSCSQYPKCEEILNQGGNDNNRIIYNNTSNSNLVLENSNEEDEKTFLEEIRKKIKEINDEGNKFFKLDYLSQYYINQRKDKIEHSISSQILMIIQRR